MNALQTWPVTFHDDFDAEFDALPIDVQDELLASADALSKLGPAAGRPHVGTLKNPKHPNMKELRFKANNGAEVWRAVFAFDTRREAIILVAAAKQGVDEDKFYRDLLFKANTRYEQHLKNLTTAKARQGKGRR
ncbi:type II toxin-antitoxin system RelE/ParE family toxin [Janthinobacterium sp. SUN073]|uniref:type II toxin-antitoxin system RelE/ParE family toxin n=1 Tax=Janthinobacterium sp. SUN073 TaxID=3004102 RepID=UPI0025B1304E|nr:type II toxin-antitoxin system RelE/ParE family toxin [Janthinobacterium sp. SUN073]MDN2699929.1 type II toxin-antitoxin system RelE/ParE family toxin [Janthinobacterium sp. SUN073]